MLQANQEAFSYQCIASGLPFHLVKMGTRVMVKSASALLRRAF